MNLFQRIVAAARVLLSTVGARLAPVAGVPLLVGLIGIAISLLLWQELDAQQTRRVHRAVQSEGAAATRQLEGELVRVLAQSAKDWDQIGAEQSTRKAATSKAATSYADSCLGVARLEPGGTVRWVVPLDPS